MAPPLRSRMCALAEPRSGPGDGRGRTEEIGGSWRQHGFSGGKLSLSRVAFVCASRSDHDRMAWIVNAIKPRTRIFWEFPNKHGCASALLSFVFSYRRTSLSCRRYGARVVEAQGASVVAQAGMPARSP